MAGIAGAEARRAALADAFAAEVAPRLPELEARRRRTLRKVGLIGLGAAALAALFAFIGAFETVLLALVAIGAAAVWCGVLARDYRNEARRTAMPAVCRAIGDIRHFAGGGDKTFLERFRKCRVLRPWSEATVDDAFDGTAADVPFLMAETRLALTRVSTDSKGKRTTSTRTLFRGLLFVIGTPHYIRPRILLRGRRRLFFTPWRPPERELAKLRRVDLPHAAFASRLTLWTDDPEAPKAVLTPALADTMARLAATAGWRGLDAAFDGHVFLLVLPRRGDLFRLGSLWRPAATLAADSERVLGEATMVHRLIATLKGEPPG